MSARITAADVTVITDERYVDGGRRIEAAVKGRNGVIFGVDLNAWGAAAWCSCGKAPTCAHIRATKEAIA